jgi:hypothetical protein
MYSCNNVPDGELGWLNRYSNVQGALWLRFGFRQGKEIFLFFMVSRPTLGPTQPPTKWLPRALSPRVKRPGNEADHSPPSSAEVKNVGAIPPLPHTSLWRGD